MNGIDNQNYTYYRTIKIDDLEIFYREAGDTAKPVILLLHGFPSSSHMFRNLIDWLASDYHLIAPDYPGSGYSACPTPENFEYTFDNLAKVIEKFIDKLNLSKITLYMQDYGGPIGFRIAKQQPELINNLIIQNANAFLEGIGPDVKKMGDLQATGDQEAIDGAISYMMSFDGIRDQYIFGAKKTDVISPDSYNMDNYLMQQPGRADVQKVLLKNYATNFPKYPEWQQYLREYQPPALITWGKNDKIFPGAGASAYLQALPGAEVHLFDGGHFLIEEYGKEIALLIHTFMKKNTR